MSIAHSNPDVPWLLLVFTLPAKGASQRVEIWRKLRRYGMLPLRSSGYVLPNSAANQERMEWLAASIRAYKGQASVVQAQGFDDLPAERLKQRFQELRAQDYQKLLHEAKQVLGLPISRRPTRLLRLRQRMQALQAIDFFGSPLRARIETLLNHADRPSAGTTSNRKSKAGDYLNRMWITRPRPGIDRVSSAWLIRRFIDPRAKFVFGTEPGEHAEAVPFDMFGPNGFGHRGDDCTFETLCKQFGIRDSRVKRIAEIIHDSDLDDDKFGRTEGLGLDRVLKGWAKQELPDDELLRRGIDLINGLYEAIA